MKKYELTDETIEVYGTALHRIKALKDFGNVKKGELGGYVESEHNLSQEGNCWVCGNAEVYDNAEVCGNAEVYDNALVYGNAEVYDNALVYGNAKVYDNALVYGNAKVYSNAKVYGNALVCGNAKVYSNALVCGNAKVCGNAEVCGNADYITIKGLGSVCRNTTIFRTKGKNIAVKCGCFYGTLAEFVDKVKETHGNSKFAKEYLALIDLVKIHFELEDK